MKVVILAGGFGTRISEFTNNIPKPMIPIGNFPIIWHIMNIYSYHGFNDFYIALGYKGEKIKEYFYNYRNYHSDFTVDVNSGQVSYHAKHQNNWKVTLIDTGMESMTGGRVKEIQKYIGDEPFFLTYGDGLADVNIRQLLEFHKTNKKMITLTAVKFHGRFGEISIQDDRVSHFSEKPDFHDSWINGGFFVVEPSVFQMIKDRSCEFEKDILGDAARKGELSAYKHHGFWQCMDTYKDHQKLESLWKNEKAPWRIYL